MSTNIVVCKYKKDCSFAYKINNNQNINVIIYDKENPEDIPVNNNVTDRNNRIFFFIELCVGLSWYYFLKLLKAQVQI